MLEADKPGTVAFLAYLDEDGSEASIVHVFPNAAAMSAHLEGVQERSEEADAFIHTTAFEIYGSPDPEVVQMMRGFAERSASRSRCTPRTWAATSRPEAPSYVGRTISPPAASTSAIARSPSPSLRSTARMAFHSTRTLKPSDRPSIAVEFTQ